MTQAIMVLDLETQNVPYYGALSSPRCPDNYVVAVGQAIEAAPFAGEITGQYFHNKAESEAWLHIPDNVWLLVMHNAPFELDWMLHTQREGIEKFLKRGGRVFCTAYAEYLLTNQQSQYPSLDETAPKYGGTHKVDGIKILWEQGYLTSQIDKALLFDEYLLGPGGDIENTRKTFYGQWALLTERGMLAMALERMEGMLFNCYAMANGLYVNREVAWAQKAAAEEKLAAITDRMKQWRTHIPEVVGFKDSSDYHMSAWLFGGPIKYREQDVWFNEDGTPKYEKGDFYYFDNGARLPIAAVTADTVAAIVAEHGPITKYSAGKNKGQPKVFREDTDVPKLKWYDRQIILLPVIDLAKMPDALRKEFLKDHSGKRTLADDSPVISTGADALELLQKRPEFADVRPLIDDLLEFAKLDKDLGTYYLREVCDAEGNVVKQSGALQYLTPESVIYHQLNCTSTVTGRLSSNRPNFQNIPRGDTSDVKNMFQSRFGDAGAIVEADYAALEVVTLAAFCLDPALVEALLNGTDMHCLRLSKKLGEDYASVLEKCKNEDHPEHKAYKTMRTDIKPPSFALN